MEENCLKIPEGPLRCILSGHILPHKDTSHKEGPVRREHTALPFHLHWYGRESEKFFQYSD